MKFNSKSSVKIVAQFYNCLFEIRGWNDNKGLVGFCEWTKKMVEAGSSYFYSIDDMEDEFIISSCVKLTKKQQLALNRAEHFVLVNTKFIQHTVAYDRFKVLVRKHGGKIIFDPMTVPDDVIFDFRWLGLNIKHHTLVAFNSDSVGSSVDEYHNKFDTFDDECSFYFNQDMIKRGVGEVYGTWGVNEAYSF